MISLYLPMVSKTFQPPFDSVLAYFIIWVAAISVFHTKIMLSRTMLTIYLFIFIYLLFSLILGNDRTKDPGNDFFLRWILVRQIGFTMLGILILKYFLYVNDYQGLALASVAAVTFMIISSFTSIISPEYFQTFVNPRGYRTEGINLSTYGLFSSIAFLSPILIYFVRNFTISLFNKILLILIWLITVYAIAIDGRTMAFLVSIIFFFIPLIIRTEERLKFIVSISVILIVTVTLLNHQLANLVSSIAGLFRDNLINIRLSDLALAIDIGDFDPQTGMTYTSKTRLSLVYKSLSSFLQNPLVGGGTIGGHSFWIDILGRFGIIGIIPWILIFKNQLEQNFSVFDNSYKLYYILSLVSLIVFGIFKSGLQAPQIMVCFFFVVPGLYFVKYLYKSDNDSC